MARGEDFKNSFEEHRKKLSESYGDAQMPLDLKGRILMIVVLVVVLATVWFMLELVIVTFILTFVFYHMLKYALRGLAKTPLKFLPAPIVQILIYVGVILLFIFLAVQNAPIIARQLGDIATSFSRFDFEAFAADIDPNLVWLVSQIDLNEYTWRIGQAIISSMASFGNAVVNFFIALFLSFLFVLEKKKITMIANSIKNSRVAFIYRYFLLFAGSFSYTFGKVMKVQVAISAVNCTILTVYMSVTGFPYIMVMSIIIFIVGLIPIAGTLITLVPMVIIGFNVGGIMKVLEVLVVMLIINAVEAYFLNPKLMSYRTALPISLVFVVLIVSQQYLGAWGMLIGIPTFIFIMNVLNIDYQNALAKKPVKPEGDGDRGGGSGGVGGGSGGGEEGGSGARKKRRNPFKRKDKEQ